MIWKTKLSLAGLVATLILSSKTFSQADDIKGCWRTEQHIFTLTDGSNRQEKGLCVYYYADMEVGVSCNLIADPNLRTSRTYQIRRQGETSIVSLIDGSYREESDFEIRGDKMILTRRHERPKRINHTDWASKITTVLTRLNLEDRENCLSQAKLISREAIKPVELAPGVIDLPRQYFKTGIRITDYNIIRWLDADHVVVTAEDGVRIFGGGRVTSVNVSTRSLTTLLDRGFLWCTNPEAALVAVIKGDLIQSSDRPSTAVFYRWDRKKNALIDEERPPKPSQSGMYWNWHTCSQTTREDSDTGKIEFLKKFVGKAYLRPEDGSLNWDPSPPPAKGFPVSLITAKGLRKPLDLSSAEFVPLPVYFPFLKGYVLMGGQYVTGGATIAYHGSEVDQLPVVTLRTDGAVARSYLPSALKTFLDRRVSHGLTFPVAGGMLAYNAGLSKEGGGIYLIKGETSTRIWCSPLNYSEYDCNLLAVEISPDGCNAVIVPHSTKSPLVLPLCDKK